MVQQIYSRRHIHDIATLGGMLVCAAVAKVLKTLLGHSRCVQAKSANACHADGVAHGCFQGISAFVQSSHANRTMSPDSRKSRSIAVYGAIPHATCHMQAHQFL